MENHTFVAIMAGGVGSRFWPASREGRPKQFLDILGTGKTLLRSTFERFLPVCPTSQIYVVTHQNYLDMVLEQLPELQPSQVICEPARRNTAPCIAYTALKLQQLDPEANLIVAPSDHIILQENAFLQAVQQGLKFTAGHDALLTLGMLPTRPDTGYGYIQYQKNTQEESVHKVLRFTEKPPLDKAQEFLQSGDYLWNAGIFIWRASAVVDALNQFVPQVIKPLEQGIELMNTEKEAQFVESVFPALENVSIDYAIMEKASNVYTMPASFGWSDLGTWASLHAESPKDAHNNVVQSSRALLYDTHNCMVRVPKDKMVVLRGLDNFIIVDEGDVLMIYPKSMEQDIKSVTQDARTLGGERYI